VVVIYLFTMYLIAVTGMLPFDVWFCL